MSMMKTRVRALFVCVTSAWLVASWASCGDATDSESAKAQPGEPCGSVDDCDGTDTNIGCPFGFCTTPCNDGRTCDGPGAAGPTCTTYFNGLQICCPESGCPGDCNAQASGQIACTDISNCCGLDQCATRAGTSGAACYTVCHSSADCDSGCCINSGLTSVDTGENVAGCVDPSTASSCL